MKQLDTQKALHFILSKFYIRTGEEIDYNDWLFEKGLLSGDETLDAEKKVAVYGKVMLTLREKETLEKYYSASELDRIYEKLDNYLLNRKKRPYKSHYAAINSWVIEQVLGGKRNEPINSSVKHWNDE